MSEKEKQCIRLERDIELLENQIKNLQNVLAGKKKEYKKLKKD